MKNFYKFGWLVIAMALLVAAGTQSNQWDFGDGTSADKVTEYKLGLGSNNPKIKATTTGINFANDGVNFLPLGSGTGGGSGGENVVANPGFETGTTNWNNTGSGAIATTTTAVDVGFGDASGDWDAAAAADKLTTDVQITPNGIANTLCIAEMFYKGGGTSNITMRVIDGSDVLIPGFNEVVIVDAATSFKRAFTEFICPAEGTSMKFQLEAAGDAPSIYIDNVHVGTKSLTRGAAGGWKTYDESVVTIDGTGSPGWVTGFSKYQPYKDPVTGAWRIRFNIQGDYTSLATGLIAINGVTFDSESQACTGRGGSSTVYGSVTAIKDTGNISWQIGAATTFLSLSCDVSLASKPTWADFDGTVNLLNNSVINSNTSVFGELAATTVLFSGFSDLLTQNVTQDGISLSTNEITIPSDGKYILTMGGRRSFGTGATFLRAYMTTSDGSNADVLLRLNFTSSQEETAKSRTVDLTKGTVIYLIAEADGTGNSSMPYVEGSSFFSVVRKTDVSSESPLGFGLADANNAGLVKANSLTEVDVSGLDTIDPSQEVFRFIKTPDGYVTIVFPKLAHSSDSNLAFGAGTIPVGFRPAAVANRATNIYYANTALVFQITVFEDGDIDIFYRNWSGTLTAASNSGDGGSITYYAGN